MCEVNNVSLLQSTLSDGKNLYCNWLKNSLTPYKKPLQDCSIASLKSQTNAFVYDNTTERLLYVD
jgi:hypothetical protein